MSLFDDLFKPSPFSQLGQRNLTEDELQEYNLKLAKEYFADRAAEDIARREFFANPPAKLIFDSPKKWWQWWR